MGPMGESTTFFEMLLRQRGVNFYVGAVLARIPEQARTQLSVVKQIDAIGELSSQAAYAPESHGVFCWKFRPYRQYLVIAVTDVWRQKVARVQVQWLIKFRRKQYGLPL